EVVVGSGQRQGFGIDGSPQRGQALEIERAGGGPAVGGNFGCVRCQDRRTLKAAADRRKPLGEVTQDQLQHEVVALGGPASQVLSNKGPVEYRRRWGHGGGLPFVPISRLMESDADIVKAAWWPRAASLGRAVGRAALDFFYPTLCLHCEAAIAQADALCGRCFAQLRPISAPRCPVLGLPFAVPIGADAV